MNQLKNSKKKIYDRVMHATDTFTRYYYNVDAPRALKFWYYMHTKKKLNIEDPKTFDEKIQWLKLYWQHPLIIKCADKYGVREYVKSKGCPEILNHLYGVYEDPAKIEWEKFPNKFVIKTTNSTDTNIICLDKNTFDEEMAEAKLEKWLNQKSEKVSTERHYAHMNPKIIAEKFIEAKKGPFPIDYKIFCFNGRPLFVSVVEGRTEEELKTNIYRTYYDLQWNRIKLDKSEVDLDRLPDKPGNFDQMIEYAKILSKDFPFVRVDFYEGEDHPIIGEMTFTPSGGAANYYRDDIQLMLGRELDLPAEKIINRW